MIKIVKITKNRVKHVFSEKDFQTHLNISTYIDIQGRN